MGFTHHVRGVYMQQCYVKSFKDFWYMVETIYIQMKMSIAFKILSF